MHIDMYIYMHMNIYITPENEARLRKLEGSMSGLINELLNGYFAQLESPPVAAKQRNEAIQIPKPPIEEIKEEPVVVPLDE